MFRVPGGRLAHRWQGPLKCKCSRSTPTRSQRSCRQPLNRNFPFLSSVAPETAGTTCRQSTASRGAVPTTSWLGRPSAAASTRRCIRHGVGGFPTAQPPLPRFPFAIGHGQGQCAATRHGSASEGSFSRHVTRQGIIATYFQVRTLSARHIYMLKVCVIDGAGQASSCPYLAFDVSAVQLKAALATHAGTVLTAVKPPLETAYCIFPAAPDLNVVDAPLPVPTMLT